MRDIGRVSRRRLAAAFLALPVATVVAVGGSAVTASPADAGRVQVSDTTLTSTSQKVTFSVKLGLLEEGKLGLTPPGGSKAVQVASGTGPKTLSYTLSLACPDYDGSCVEDGRKTPARNGKWTVTFGSRVLVLGSGSDSSFVVAAPPKTPTRVAAAATGDDVKVQWRKGAEPDLSSYRVAVGSQSKKVSASRACGGSTCSAVLPAPASGGRTPVAVKATRNGYGSAMSSPTAKTTVDVARSASQRSSRGGSGGLPSGYGGTGGTGGTGGAGGGGSAGFPSPNLRPGGTMPGGMPSSDPYPSFGAQPKVAPATSSPAAAGRPAVQPLAYGHVRGDAAVPVAMALVLVLAGGHVWLLSRAGRLRPALAAGVHRATRGRRRRSK